MTAPRLHFHEEGPAEAPAVVLLHSLATHSDLWLPQVPVWRQTFRLIRIDLPGHGASPECPEAHRLEAMAALVVEVLDHLRIDRAAVVGLSLGGMVAQALALDHASRIEALVVAHAGARTEPPVRDIWRQRIAQFEAGGMQSLCDATLQRWFPREFAERAPLTLEWVASLIRATRPGGYVAAIQAIQGLDFLDRLAGIRVPTLVMAGDADAAVPAAVAGQLAERIAGARSHLLPDTGHIGNVQSPTAFTEIVGGFLLQAMAGRHENTPLNTETQP